MALYLTPAGGCPPAAPLPARTPVPGLWAARAVWSVPLALAAGVSVAGGAWSADQVFGAAPDALTGLTAGLVSALAGVLSGTALVLLWVPWGRIRMLPNPAAAAGQNGGG